MYAYTLRAALGTRLDLSNFIPFHKTFKAVLLRKKIFRFAQIKKLFLLSVYEI